MIKYFNIIVSLLVGTVGLIVFFLLANWLGWATYDLGILQKLFLATFEMPIIYGVALMFFALSFPGLYKYIKNDFDTKHEWNVLTERERTISGLALFGLLVLCYVILVALQ